MLGLKRSPLVRLPNPFYDSEKWSPHGGLSLLKRLLGGCFS